MDLKPGDVVMLKSEGHSLCVAEVNEDAVECVWMGNEGGLHRETLPVVVLELVDSDASDDEDDDHENQDHEDEDNEKHEHDEVA